MTIAIVITLTCLFHVCLIVLERRWIVCHSKNRQFLLAKAKQYQCLRDAVFYLYYTAHWTPDRECDADKLWIEVRNAACFTPGYAPEPKE